MFTNHPEINTPPDHVVLWRYIDLERLLALLSTRSLHLTRIDNFRDKWEGLWPKPLIDLLSTSWKQEGVDYFTNTSASMKRTHFVSCWHSSDHESAALWDQYSRKSGIAIRSTVARLKTCVWDKYNFFIGNVDYIDHSGYRDTRLNLLIPPFLKRKSFEHEREVRLLVSQFGQKPELDLIDWRRPPESVSLKVELGSLIESVYLCPEAPPWLASAIRDLLNVYGLGTVPLIQSTLYDAAVQ